MFGLQSCPNCKRRSILSRPTIYRCLVCGRICCDWCIKRGLFGHSCPHCGARSSLMRAGYLR